MLIHGKNDRGRPRVDATWICDPVNTYSADLGEMIEPGSAQQLLRADDLVAWWVISVEGLDPQLSCEIGEVSHNAPHRCKTLVTLHSELRLESVAKEGVTEARERAEVLDGPGIAPDLAYVLESLQAARAIGGGRNCFPTTNN
jgi:hypothetical protein